eukprot:3630964-Rhodomonas_salina.1
MPCPKMRSCATPHRAAHVAPPLRKECHENLEAKASLASTSSYTALKSTRKIPVLEYILPGAGARSPADDAGQMKAS